MPRTTGAKITRLRQSYGASKFKIRARWIDLSLDDGKSIAAGAILSVGRDAVEPATIHIARCALSLPA